MQSSGRNATRARRSVLESPTKLIPEAMNIQVVDHMSRSESVPTSKRLRLRGRRPPITPDGAALDELAECLDGDAGDTDDTDRVDAVELELDGASAEETLEALQEFVDAGYDVSVRDLVVELKQ
jgi:hypothetical protein